MCGNQADRDLIHRIEKIHTKGKAGNYYRNMQVWDVKIYIPVYRWMDNNRRVHMMHEEDQVRIRHVFNDFQRTLKDLGCVVRCYLE